MVKVERRNDGIRSDQYIFTSRLTMMDFRELEAFLTRNGIYMGYWAPNGTVFAINVEHATEHMVAHLLTSICEIEDEHRRRK
jgi:hypothetical protein